MLEITLQDAKNRFGQLLDATQRGPVYVTRNGKAVAVMLSQPHYERLRGAAWESLTATMDALANEASAGGLTDDTLEVLLAGDD